MPAYQPSYDFKTRREFEAWLAGLEKGIAELLARVPADVAHSMDYSPDSLLVLERWLLDNYPTIDALEQDRTVLDGATFYVGEIYRKVLGGQWGVDLVEDSSGQGYPTIEVEGMIPFYPSTDVTASLDRRRGDFMHTLFEKRMQRKLRGAM